MMSVVYVRPCVPNPLLAPKKYCEISLTRSVYSHFKICQLKNFFSPFHVGKSFLLNPNDTYQYLYRIRTKYSSTMQERVKVGHHNWRREGF